MLEKTMAVGPNNLSAILLTNINLCTFHQVTAYNYVVTMRENYHRGNKVTDLLIYPAGLITQNTTLYIQKHSRKQLLNKISSRISISSHLGFQLISIIQESLDCNNHCGR